MQTISRKIVLIGDIGVGKTSIVKRYVYSLFDEKYLSTIGVKVDKKELIIDNVSIKLMIWDLAGELISKALYNKYLKGADGVIAVYDITRPDTYDIIMNEVEKLKNEGIFCLIVANKSDLIDQKKRTSNDDSVDQYFDFLTSAKNGKDIENAFHQIAHETIN